MAQSIRHNEYTGSSLIDLAEPPAVVTKESLLEIVQGFDWLLDHKIDKQRIANDLLSLYKPENTAERDRLAGLCLMYLSTVMYEVAKYAADEPHSVGQESINKPMPIVPAAFRMADPTAFIRQNKGGDWQICNIAPDGSSATIQDITWKDAENWFVGKLNKPDVIDALARMLDEEKGYPADDESRIAVNAIETIIREAM